MYFSVYEGVSNDVRPTTRFTTCLESNKSEVLLGNYISDTSRGLISTPIPVSLEFTINNIPFRT